MMITYAESIRILQERASKLQRSSEEVPVREAHSRVPANALYALRSNPAWPVASMDGIAIESRLAAAVPVTLREGEWTRINTGEPIPAGADSVVRIEDVQWDGSRPVITTAVKAGQWIRAAGEDFQAGRLLFAEGRRLSSADLSLLLAAGHDRVEVYRKPRVRFIPTGSELVIDPRRAKPGQVIESNSAMVGGMVEGRGGEFYRAQPAPDDIRALKRAIGAAARNSNLVVVSAGTSAGARDLTAEAVQALGRIEFHHVALHPARPVLFGDVRDIPVLGLPGYPAAAWVACHLYLLPLVSALSGDQPDVRLAGCFSAEEIGTGPVDSFFRMSLFDVAGRLWARKLGRGSGSLLSLAMMDGLLQLPPGKRVRAGEPVRVELVREPAPGAVALAGVSNPAALRMFDGFRAAFPGRRLLFWESTAEDALEKFQAGSLHAAVVPAGISPKGGETLVAGLDIVWGQEPGSPVETLLQYGKEMKGEQR